MILTLSPQQPLFQPNKYQQSKQSRRRSKQLRQSSQCSRSPQFLQSLQSLQSSPVSRGSLRDSSWSSGPSRSYGAFSREQEQQTRSRPITCACEMPSLRVPTDYSKLFCGGSRTGE